MEVEQKTNLVRLTQGLFTIVDEKDLHWITRYKWYAKRTTAKNKDYGTYYAARHKRINGVEYTIYLHREITNCPEGMEVDHRDGNSLDNTEENLRVCTRSQNNEYREERFRV